MGKVRRAAIVVLAALGCAPLLAAADHYTVDARYSLLAPTVLADGEPGYLLPVRLDTIGVSVTENYDGPMTAINRFIIAVLSAGNLSRCSSGCSDGQGHQKEFQVQSAPGLTIGNVEGASWSFDRAPGYFQWHLTQPTVVGGGEGVGWRLSLRLGMRFFTDKTTRASDCDPNAAQPSALCAVLLREHVSSLWQTSGGDVSLLLDWYVQPIPWVMLSAGYELPPGYVVFAPFSPLFSADTAATVLQWTGQPRTGLGLSGRLGPLHVAVKGRVPNALVFVPWHVSQAELLLQAGLAF